MKITVTGATGFVGRHLVKALEDLGHKVMAVSSRNFDLLSPDGGKCVQGADVVYHLAALVGGIGANRNHPGRFFYENIQMGINIIEAARRYGSRIIMVGTTCSYPKNPYPIPFREFSLFNGYPEETNAPYGIAKRALLAMLKAYQQEYGLDYTYLIPTNLYGPGDNFNDNTSHVIPALIKKTLRAKETGEPLAVWGTGRATRDFLYIDDCVKALAAAIEFAGTGPLNLGSGAEISIGTLVYYIKELTNCKSRIAYDTSMPDGQPRRCLDTREAAMSLGWEAETELKEGLRETIEWYKKQN